MHQLIKHSLFFFPFFNGGHVIVGIRGLDQLKGMICMISLCLFKEALNLDFGRFSDLFFFLWTNQPIIQPFDDCSPQQLSKTGSLYSKIQCLRLAKSLIGYL